MTLTETLISIWQQVLEQEKEIVELEVKAYRVGRTRAKKLRTVDFEYERRLLEGIEQNPQTTSQWAALAREGKRVMQFSSGHRYVGNVCEGERTQYAAWFALRLPE